MPVSVLVSKLMKKKILSNSTIVVTSRPQQADELGQFHFDGLMEVEGFSPKQVKEFIQKYFHSKPKNVSDRVLEHIVSNENLLGTAHIPMMCFLMCWCLEWQIESNTQNDLPNTLTELYSDVVRIFETKHHSKSKYRTTQIAEGFQVPSVVKDTLDKLSKLAAETVVINKFIFNEDDVQKFGISSEEIELLKASGLLTCGPGLRKTPFATTRDYCFSHLTLHEYFAACEFVQNNKYIPTSITYESSLVPVFMAGLLGREKNENTMEQLLQMVILRENDISLATFLFEYHDEEFGVKMIKKYLHCFKERKELDLRYLQFVDIANKDSTAVTYFLNLLCETNRESKAQEYKTSSLEPFVLKCDNFQAVAKSVCESLKKQFCPITSLQCDVLKEDTYYECLLEALPNTNITNLHFHMTSWDFFFKHAVMLNVDVFCRKLATLLAGTNKVINLTLQTEHSAIEQMVEFSNIKDLSKEIQSTQIPTTLEILLSLFTDDEPLQYVSDALVSANITTLHIKGHQATDRSLRYLSQALPFSNVTTLIIQGSESITDNGLHYLSDSLPSTNINTLKVFDILMTCKELQYLCANLPSTKITTLALVNSITDEGLQYLSESLPSTNITKLILGGDWFTDEGLQFLCISLPSTNITSLTGIFGGFTDKGFRHLCQILPSTKINSVEFALGNQRLVHLYEILPLGKLTLLKLYFDDTINESDLQQLIKALQSSSITTLYLHGIDCPKKVTNITGLLCELLPSMKISINETSKFTLFSW